MGGIAQCPLNMPLISYVEQLLSESARLYTWCLRTTTVCHLLILAGKATPVGAKPGVTRSVMEKIKVSVLLLQTVKYTLW